MTKIIIHHALYTASDAKLLGIIGQTAFEAATESTLADAYSVVDAAAHLLECIEGNEQHFGDGTGATYSDWNAADLVAVGLGFDGNQGDVTADDKALQELKIVAETLIHHYASRVEA